MTAHLNVCIYSVRFTAPLTLLLFGALCGLIIKISFPLRVPKKNRPSVGSGAAEVAYYAV